MKKSRKTLQLLFLMMFVLMTLAACGGEETQPDMVVVVPVNADGEAEITAADFCDGLTETADQDLLDECADYYVSLSATETEADVYALESGGGGDPDAIGGNPEPGAADPTAGGSNPNDLPSTGKFLDYCESDEAAETLADGGDNTMTTPEGEVITLCSLRHQDYVAESFEKNPITGNPNPPANYCQDMPADADPALKALCADNGG